MHDWRGQKAAKMDNEVKEIISAQAAIYYDTSTEYT